MMSNLLLLHYYYLLLLSMHLLSNRNQKYNLLIQLKSQSQLSTIYAGLLLLLLTISYSAVYNGTVALVLVTLYLSIISKDSSSLIENTRTRLSTIILAALMSNLKTSPVSRINSAVFSFWNTPSEMCFSLKKNHMLMIILLRTRVIIHFDL